MKNRNKAKVDVVYVILLVTLTISSFFLGKSAVELYLFSHQEQAQDYEIVQDKDCELDINEELAKLPEYAQNEVKDCDIEIVSVETFETIINDESKEERDTSKTPMKITGMTRHCGNNDIKVFIINDTVDGRNALPHEIGHVADWNHSVDGVRLSETLEFKELYEEEKDSYDTGISSVNRDHVTKNSVEFFAEIYKDIIICNWKALNSAPKSAEFVRQICK